MHKPNLLLPTRVPRLFLGVAQADYGYEFTIPFDWQALADYLGVERSAMSAELGKLRKEGVLDFKGSHFVLYRT